MNIKGFHNEENVIKKILMNYENMNKQFFLLNLR